MRGKKRTGMGAVEGRRCIIVVRCPITPLMGSEKLCRNMQVWKRSKSIKSNIGSIGRQLSPTNTILQRPSATAVFSCPNHIGQLLWLLTAVSV
jgi:hypothetical protein